MGRTRAATDVLLLGHGVPLLSRCFLTARPMRVLLGRLLLPLRSARLCLRRLILIFLPLYLSRLVRRPYIFRLALEDSVFLTKVFPFLRIRFWLQAVLRALLRWLILHGRVPLMVVLRHPDVGSLRAWRGR